MRCFGEPLPTVTAAIAALTQVRKGVSGHGDILDDLNRIVMDMVSGSPTDRAAVFLTGQFNMDMELPENFLTFVRITSFKLSNFEV